MKTSKFPIRRASKKRKLQEKPFPEVNTLESRFNLQPETAAAKSLKIVRKNNTDFSTVMKKISPWDFPMDLDCILSEKVPKHYDITKSSRINEYGKEVETVTREYEESFMTEPIGDQRPCINGQECEGNFIPNSEKPFTLREFLYPSENEIYKKTGHYPSQQNRCIFCIRCELARAIIYIRANGVACRQDTILQKHRNLVDIPGEYRLQDCILTKKDCWEGIIDPVVLHTRNSYKFELVNGTKTYKQWNHTDPSHFLMKKPTSS